MLIYIIYFIFIAILAIQYEFTPFKNNYLLFSVVFLLALLAGFRNIDVSRDYVNYQTVFDNVYEITDTHFAYLLSFEPGFIAIVIFFRKFFEFNYGVAIMLFYALVSLVLKVFTVNRLSINPYLTLLFYFSYFFVVHEMTQIRIGLASAFFLISLISFLNGNRRVFVALILLATLFHYSAIFYLLLLLFNTKNFNRNLYIVLLLLSLILGFFKLPILILLGNFDFSNLSSKLANYVAMSENGILFINVFNSINLLNILCCFYFIFFIKKEILINDKRLNLFLKCNILSIFLLSFLAGAPAFSLRFNQLFGIANIFLFTYLVKYLPAKRLNIFILVLIAGYFFYNTVFYGGLLNTYKIINIK